MPGGDAHAGRTETSLLLALDPRCVRLDRAEPGATAPLADLICPSCARAGWPRSRPNGVLGDPTGASADEGADLFEPLIADLVAAVDRAFPR